MMQMTGDGKSLTMAPPCRRTIGSAVSLSLHRKVPVLTSAKLLAEPSGASFHPDTGETEQACPGHLGRFQQSRK